MKYDKLAVNKIYLILFISILVCAFSVSGVIYNNTINSTYPSYYLEFGDGMNEGANDYEIATEISSVLSDDIDNVSFLTSIGAIQRLYNTSNVITAYPFNQLSLTSTLYDLTGNYDGSIVGELGLIQNGDYYGGYFDGANDYVQISDDDVFDIPDEADFSFVAYINTTANFGTPKGIITKRGINNGFWLEQTATETVRCRFNGVDADSQPESTTTINDNIIHVVICRKNNQTHEIWVDGVLEDTEIDDVGLIENDLDMFFGSKNAGASKWIGTIFGVGFANYSVSNDTIRTMSIEKSLLNKSEGSVIHAFFNHTFEAPDLHNHFLVIDSDVPDITTVRVMTYINSTHPNSSNYKDFTITSGDNFLPLEDLIHEGYNNPFRYWEIQRRFGTNLYNMYLLESINDTENPSVFNCQINISELGCNDVVRLQCNITDNTFLFKSFYTVNLTFLSLEGVLATQEVNKQGEIWYVDYSSALTYNGTVQIIWQLANASDVNGNYNETILNLPMNYTCLEPCQENWNTQYGGCTINDTRLMTYQDSNFCNTTNDLPDDNGTYVSCNYCDPDIVAVESLCAYVTGTYVRNITYTDNLYAFCCGVTGLASDCVVDFSPYNETTQEFCTIFNNTMDCDSNTYTEYGFLGDKVRWICYPPATNNISTHCMSYVKDPSHGVLQTNPNYITRTDSIISIDNEYEDRTSFEAVGNMVSVYFTKDNLLFDGREYIFGVRCTNDGDYYDYEQLIIPEYENVNAPITRLFWLRWNIVGLFLGGVAMLVIVIIIAGHIRELRRR